MWLPGFSSQDSQDSTTRMSFSHHVGRLDSLGSRFRGISEVWHPRASIQGAASMNVRPEKKNQRQKDGENR